MKRRMLRISGASRLAGLRNATVGGAFVVGLVLPGLAAGAGEGVSGAAAPVTAQPAPVATTLPRLFTETSMASVRGRILRSTRGRPGPVRLEVERSDGGQIAVLLAPDEVCEKLGLSLRAGEEIDVRGALYQGRSPILVAASVTVNGKEIQVPRRVATRPAPQAVPGGSPPSPGSGG